MRASTSCPRSSVPRGWLALGPCSRAVKSMSLIANGQSNGPSSTARIIARRTMLLATARRWRRKRRHASRAGEICGAARLAAASAVSDAGVEPAIKHIRDQVEQDDEAREDEGDGHDDRRVVREDR